MLATQKGHATITTTRFRAYATTTSSLFENFRKIVLGCNRTEHREKPHVQPSHEQCMELCTVTNQDAYLVIIYVLSFKFEI